MAEKRGARPAKPSQPPQGPPPPAPPGGIEMRGPDHEEAMRLHAALYTIANLSSDMPPAYNDEGSWYRHRFWKARGIAQRAIEEAPDASQ